MNPIPYRTHIIAAAATVCFLLVGFIGYRLGQGHRPEAPAGRPAITRGDGGEAPARARSERRHHEEDREHDDDD